MKIPYNRVHAQDVILFAARGGKIHSFSLLDGRHLSTWQHPDVEKAPSNVRAEACDETAPLTAEAGEARGADESEPQAKRQKREDDKHGSVSAGDAETSAAGTATQVKDDAGDGKGSSKGTDKTKKKHGKPKLQGRQHARVPDRPVITQVTSTADGRHVLAVSGHDKAIWVFEHDSQGKLAQLSKRTMPKRPSAVAITTESQIICADKFGDVYCLPLVPTPRAPSSMPQPSPSTPKPVAKPAAPAASTLTVHSKRNLEALKNQTRHLKLESQKRGEESKADGPDFELTLLLGHVSMLTSLVLGESENRRYILTSDRDEHIRVSRHMPQTHVIEGFCLGHKQFVSDMVIPAARGDILVSGGGDEELFVWDWKAGKLLSRASILSLARVITRETSKVAVSGLYSLLYPSEAGNVTYVLAICEDLKAIFSWHLAADNTLHHPGIIQLPANPLHLCVCASGTAQPRLVVAMDPGETPARSLHVLALTVDKGTLAVHAEALLQDDGLAAGEMDVSESEVRGLLYTVENLRKQTCGGEDGGSDGAEADATEAEAGDTLDTLER